MKNVGKRGKSKQILGLSHHGDDDLEAKDGDAHQHHDVEVGVRRLLREDDAEVVPRERVDGEHRGEASKSVSNPSGLRTS